MKVNDEKHDIDEDITVTEVDVTFKIGFKL